MPDTWFQSFIREDARYLPRYWDPRTVSFATQALINIIDSLWELAPEHIKEALRTDRENFDVLVVWGYKNHIITYSERSNLYTWLSPSHSILC